MKKVALFILSFFFLSSTVFASQKGDVKVTWTPASEGVLQKLVVKQIPNGFIGVPEVDTYKELPMNVSSAEITVDDENMVFIQIATMMEGEYSASKSYYRFNIKFPNITEEIPGPYDGASNIKAEILRHYPDPDFVQDNISIVESSAGSDGVIKFGTDGKPFVRPNYMDDTQYIVVRNNGSNDVSILSSAAINAYMVMVNPSASISKPVVIKPGQTQRFSVAFHPLYWTTPQIFSFTPESGSFLKDNPASIFIRSKSAVLEVPVKGQSTYNADINYDGKVNLGDLGALRGAFSGVYNPLCDINGDGVINLGDLGVLRKEYLLEV